MRGTDAGTQGHPGGEGHREAFSVLSPRLGPPATPTGQRSGYLLGGRGL